jgi:hypothetical protein
MTFYISNWSGKEMAGGKRFATLEAAIEAGKTVMRRSLSNHRAHGTTAVDVVEEIPGNHQTRAIITPELEVITR